MRVPAIGVAVMLFVACDRPAGRAVARPQPPRTPLPSDLELMAVVDRTRQSEHHPKESHLSQTLKGLTDVVYGGRRLEWIDERIYSLEHPDVFRHEERDFKAWRAYGPDSAYAARQDFSGDFARVLWVEQSRTSTEAFFIYLVYRGDRWCFVGPVLLRGGGDTWRDFYLRQAGRLAIGRRHIERLKTPPSYPPGFTESDLLELVKRVEDLSRMNGMKPIGLWFDLLYSSSETIRNYGTDRLIDECGIKTRRLKPGEEHDPWFQDIGRQIH